VPRTEALEFTRSELRKLGAPAGSVLEYTENGQNRELPIHLDEASKRHQLVITRVILAPEYLPLLWATETGRKLRKRLPFLETPAWIRHDEHYHVDFAVASR
jgi:hypothetical protein